MRVTVPNRAYLSDIERFLRTFTQEGNGDFVLHLPNGLFSLHPLATAMIASRALATRERGGRVEVEGLAANSSTRYLERMGLFTLMGIESGIPVVAHEASGRFVPLRQVNTNDELNEFVVDIVPLLHGSATESAAVKYVLFELVRNVLEHARSRSGAIVSAQVTRSGRLLIGVADAGRGIRASLSESHPAASDADAIKLAFRPGITGVTRRLGGNETNGGAGLFFMKSMAVVARTRMVTISGDSMFKLLSRPINRITIHADVNRDYATGSAFRGEAPPLASISS
jgi:anti-sigma regulatory factor (Ser/Thr protein kinase)